MNLWQDLSYGEKAPEVVNMVVECPRGSKNKYEIDKKTGLIKLDRAMKTSQDYPFDYGFMPQTLWDDDDALDVVLFTTSPLAPGILVDARVIGVMHMVDCGESDDKILAVPAKDPRWDTVKSLKDMNPHTLKEMQHFFETYKTIEDGKKVIVKGFEGKKEAFVAVKKGIRMYAEKFGKK